MFLIFLLCSFFIELSASGTKAISVEDLIDGLDRGLKGNFFECKSLSPVPTTNLITVLVPKNFIIIDGQREDETSGEVCSIFQVHDQRGIVMRGNTFTPTQHANASILSGIEMYRASGCTRAVAAYSHGDSKICFKHWPEAPRNDKTIYQMYRALFPHVAREDVPIPSSVVILMNRQVFSISEFMEGESLDDVLKKVESDPTQARKYKFNLQRFQRLAVLCVATVPEDCHSRNILVKPIRDSTEEYEFVLIDTERSLGRETTEEYAHPDRGNISTGCHCFLLWFHEMLSQPLAEGIFSRLCDREAFSKTFMQESTYQLALSQRVSVDDRARSILCTPTDKIATRSMRLRCRILGELLSKDGGRSRSLADIFAETAPELNRRYGFKDYVASPTAEPEIITILRRIKASKDHGRYSGPTPPSADVPLEYYFGFTVNSPQRILDAQKWISDIWHTLDAEAKIRIATKFQLLTRILSIQLSHISIKDIDT